ncbi:MAG: RNA polymerase sigma-70 factor [Gemmatimonadota bacterium]
MTDHELLAALRTGSEEAFDAIFRTYYARLVRSSESMLGVLAPAEELAQDVMLELWRRRTSLVVETSLQAYLFRSIRNRTLNYIRHEKIVQRGAQHAAHEQSAAPAGERGIVEEEIDVALRNAMRALPPRCREVFELSRMQGLKYAEIATVLEISVKTVEAQMSKALRIMRERLADYLS